MDPNAVPTRRLTEARRRRAKLAAADLLSERFSRDSTAIWWVSTPPELDDSTLMQGTRRRALSEAIDGYDDEENA